ncbi:MAG: hypothetical protein QNL04_00340 [SAR324 cluster bacterium]|nr:hypothetical protein [SAR324 cluster bacterium]
MEFILHYHGELFSNGTPKHKHFIRKKFHEQLKILWGEPPLSQYRDFLQKENPAKRDDWQSIIFSQGEHDFAPLICEKLGLVADLDLFILQPAEPGKILNQAADIDNRLKTLFDALQKPDDNQTPEGAPDAGEAPFFCVMEDDRLITQINIRTGRLLEPTDRVSEVRLFLRVNIKSTGLDLGLNNSQQSRKDDSI